MGNTNTTTKQTTKNIPFLVCNENQQYDTSSEGLSEGRNRQNEILVLLKVSKNNIQTIYNKKYKTCFIAYKTNLTDNTWLINLQKEFQLDKEKKDHISIQPYSYSMKMLSGSIDLIDNLLSSSNSDDNDNNDESEDSSSNDNNANKRKKLLQNNIIIDIFLCPGFEFPHVNDDDDNNNTAIENETGNITKSEEVAIEENMNNTNLYNNETNTTAISTNSSSTTNNETNTTINSTLSSPQEDNNTNRKLLISIKQKAIFRKKILSSL